MSRNCTKLRFQKEPVLCMMMINDYLFNKMWIKHCIHLNILPGQKTCSILLTLQIRDYPCHITGLTDYDQPNSLSSVYNGKPDIYIFPF